MRMKQKLKEYDQKTPTRVPVTTVSSECYTLNKDGGYFVTRANIKHLTHHKKTKWNSVLTLCAGNKCLSELVSSVHRRIRLKMIVCTDCKCSKCIWTLEMEIRTVQ